MAFKEHKPKPSFWDQQEYFERIDIAVIGSGIVGLNAAINAKEMNPKLEVAVIERGPLPVGASTRNAGFACFGSISEILADMENQGETEILNLVDLRLRGLHRLRERVGDSVLQYESLGGYEAFRGGEQISYDQCKDALPRLNELLAPITGIQSVYQPMDSAIDRFGFKGIEHLIYNQAEGLLNPGKMISALTHQAEALGVRFFFGMEIEEIEETEDGVSLMTDLDWELKVNKVIIATNGFSRKLLPKLDIKPSRNQVLITKPIAGLKLKGAFHMDRGYFYFRHVGDRVLLGGGRNLAADEETTDQFGVNHFILSTLSQLLRTTIIPDHDYELDQSWSGILGLGVKRGPILQKQGNHIIIAVRLGGMGVAIGSLVGEEAAKLALS